MGIAMIAIFIVISGCLIFVCVKNANKDVVGPCGAPENGDVELDTACNRHLKLSNSELPSSLE